MLKRVSRGQRKSPDSESFQQVNQQKKKKKKKKQKQKQKTKNKKKILKNENTLFPIRLFFKRNEVTGRQNTYEHHRDLIVHN